MKKFILFISVAAALCAAMISCHKNVSGIEPLPPLSVDSLMASAEALVDDTVYVEGFCSHLCAHGGRKAFITGADSAIVLRCEATAEMGGAFSPECAGHNITVRGIVRENRIDEAAVAEMEAAYAAADTAAKAHQGCATDRKAQGQANIDAFAARMADYRARIADRAATTGKNYLSFYYLEAISYTIDDTTPAPAMAPAEK